MPYWRYVWIAFWAPWACLKPLESENRNADGSLAAPPARAVRSTRSRRPAYALTSSSFTPSRSRSPLSSAFATDFM